MQGIDGIIKFQKDRNLDKQDYNGLNEQVNIVEELLESVGLDIPKENRQLLSENFSVFISEQEENGVALRLDKLTYDDMVDAYNDVIVFAIGSIMKLGYNPKLTLKEVSKEINSRAGKIVNGKFEKYLPNEEGYTPQYKADYSTCKYHKD